jgi:exosome complex RNA-binding protein Rrp42 (RNase PH superfamily)
MTYNKRLDGRQLDETRPIEAKVGVIKNVLLEGTQRVKYSDG